MEFRILGTLEVLDGARRVELPQGRGRALLALLVLHAGQPVSADRLIDELWDEHPPPTASTVVHGLVSKLRNLLEPGRRRGESGAVLQTIGTSYRLAVDPSAIDAHRFKQLIDEARGAAPDVRATKLASALGLWRGPALADLSYVPFAQRVISALDELRIGATEDRLEADLALGGGAALVAELEQLGAQHPYRERLRACQMLALYRSGRQAEALDAYRRARATLVDELGIEPGPTLHEFEAAILRQDPALELPRAQATPPRQGTSGSWMPRERRAVTVVSLDVAPMTVDGADIEAAAQLGARAVSVAAETLERHGARVERLLGEIIMAFFGFPLAHEDDAQRACLATVEAGRAIDRLNDDPTRIHPGRHRWRAGIESGDVVVPGPVAGLRELAGIAPSVAMRLQQRADEGGIVVGPQTRRLVQGTVILRAVDASGGTDRGCAWRVLEVVPRAPVIDRTLDSPMVGRQPELTRLRSMFRRAVSTDAATAVTVLGDAGIGKSRLCRELIASVGPDAHALTLRCPAHDDAIYPMRDAVVGAAGLVGWRALHDLLAENDRHQVPADVAASIGLPAHIEHTRALVGALRGLLSVLATVRPLIVVLEDLHWAQPAFLDLVDELAGDLPERVLLLCLARPEIAERHAPWGGTDHAMHLTPLPTTDVEDLVLDRRASINPEQLKRIVDLSQGNPLFAEQLLAADADGTVESVPASLLGLLSIRLDRLGPAERDVMRCASVIGMDFDEDTVSALLPAEAHPFLPRHLDTLERRRMLDQIGPRSFRFHHALIQRMAYRTMTREDQTRLHEALTGWLDHHGAGRTGRGTTEMTRMA